MNFKNLKINKRKIAALLLAGSLTLSLPGCNRQTFDFNKTFNSVVETNGDNVSTIAIAEYADYEGSQVQFLTRDGLRVLTGTHKTQLLNVSNESALQSYALTLAGNDSEKVIDYNEMQGISINTEGGWNKDFFDLNFSFNKAIVLTDETATILDLNTWRDYEEDDKIQLVLTDGTCLLTEIDHLKLINDEYAQEDSLKNYAISLVGSEEQVRYYGKENITK